MTTNKYTVMGLDGVTPITILNESLAERQKITDEQLEALKLSHQLRWMLFEIGKNSTKVTPFAFNKNPITKSIDVPIPIIIKKLNIACSRASTFLL